MAARARRALPASFCFAAVLLCPLLARASGQFIGENGSLITAEGGTAAALPGTAYGLEFNPATLADVNGLDFRVDFRFVGNPVTFTRATIPGTTQSFAQVSNTAPVSFAPAIYAAYRQKNWPVAFGLGLWGPAGDAWYTYPNPQDIVKTGTSYANADAQSGQRYTLINSSNSIQLPTLGVAWRALKWLSIGLSVQVAVADLTTTQAVAAGSNAGIEAVNADAYAHLRVQGTSGPIFLPGILFTPVPGLTIGGEYQSAYSLNAPGYIRVSLVDSNNGALNQNGDAITLALNQPATARFGLRYETGRWSVSAEGTYEGWSAFNKVVLNGSSVTISSPSLCGMTGAICNHSTGLGTESLGTQTVTMDWKDAWGGRAGASYRILTEAQNGFGLQVHLGVLYDSNAIPSAYQTVQAVTGNQYGGSVGVTLNYYGFGLTLAAMGFLPQQLNINDSVVDRGVSGLSGKDEYPIYVGNGVYNESAWVASVGVSYTGGG